MKSFRSIRVMLMAVLAGAGPVNSAIAVTFNVNSPFDIVAGAPLDNGVCETGPGNGVCTLRAAIMKANHWPGGGATINIPAGTYTLTLPPVSVTDETKGSLKIMQSTNILGAGMGNTFVDGGGTDSVFRTNSGQIAMSDMTIQNGYANGAVSGIAGGGIFNTSNLTLNRIRVTTSRATLGAGIASFWDPTHLSTVIINNSLVDNNIAINIGGGIYDQDSMVTINRSAIVDNVGGSGIFGYCIKNDVVFTVNDTTVSGNRALDGGGIYADWQRAGCSLAVNRSTINANTASGSGGGIYNFSGSMTITDSTISANSAQVDGGGIYSTFGSGSLFHVTIAGNIANSDYNLGSLGAGAAVFVASGSVSFWNSLIADNTATANVSQCAGAGLLISQDYNGTFSPVAFACGFTGITTHNLEGDDALLGSLKNNGGATATHALGVGSIAADRIPPALCRDALGVAPFPDQRGVPRPINGLCDMGAFEGAVAMPLLNSNLIRNGDAEDGGGSMAGEFVNSPRWLGADFTVVPYGAPGGFPTIGTDRIPAVHGYNFFAGGNSVPGSAIGTQNIDVSAIGTAIDAGQIIARLAGDFGGYGAQDDAASLLVFFYNAVGDVLGSETIGGVTPGDRGNATALLHRAASILVPAGTRILVVELLMTHGAAPGYNDGYADNLSLILTGGASAPVLQNVVSRKTHGAGTFNLPLAP